MGFILRSPFLPILSHLKQKQLKPTRLPWVPTNKPIELLQKRNLHSLPNVRTQALTTSSLIVGIDSSPAASGDLSVFIPTSAILLFLYWIANFVVPDIISKNLLSDKPSKDQIPKDKNPS